MKKNNKILITLLLFSVILISLSAVSAAGINNGTLTSNNTNVNNNQIVGTVHQDSSNQAAYAENIQKTSTDGDSNSNTTNTTNITSENSTSNKVNITIANFTQTYGTAKNLTINVTNASNGNHIIGQHIGLNLTRLSDGKSKIYWATTDINGQAFLNIELSPGSYSVLAFHDNDTNFKNFTVLKIATGFIQDNFEVNRKGEYYRTILFNQYGYLLNGQTVYFTISNGKTSKTYSSTTNGYGYGLYPINLGVGKYTVTCTYNGNSTTYGCSRTSNITIYSTTHKMPTTITASGVNNNTITVTKGKNLTLNVRENNGLLIPQAKLTVKLTIGKTTKTYTVTTGSNGYANLPIKLTAGTYQAKFSYAGNTFFASTSTTNTLIIKNA